MPVTTRRCAPSKYRMSHAVTRWAGCRISPQLSLCGRRYDGHKFSRSRTDLELKKGNRPWKPVVAKECQCTRKCTEPGRNLIDEWKTVDRN